MSTHPSDCFCSLCVQQVRGQADAAQAQTLRIFDDLSRLRRRLRSLRAVVVAETERMTRIIDSHIGPLGAMGGPESFRRGLRNGATAGGSHDGNLVAAERASSMSGEKNTSLVTAKPAAKHLDCRQLSAATRIQQP